MGPQQTCGALACSCTSCSQAPSRFGTLFRTSPFSRCARLLYDSCAVTSWGFVRPALSNRCMQFCERFWWHLLAWRSCKELRNQPSMWKGLRSLLVNALDGARQIFAARVPLSHHLPRCCSGGDTWSRKPCRRCQYCAMPHQAAALPCSLFNTCCMMLLAPAGVAGNSDKEGGAGLQEAQEHHL